MFDLGWGRIDYTALGPVRYKEQCARNKICAFVLMNLIVSFD